MSMHMIRGVQVHGVGKRRKAKRKSNKLVTAEAEHNKFLKKLGIGKSSGDTDYRYDLPNLNCGPSMTSDQVAGNGTAKERKRYTGNEIAGIVVTHKSNLMPVRKDNKQAAIDAASMRR